MNKLQEIYNIMKRFIELYPIYVIDVDNSNQIIKILDEDTLIYFEIYTDEVIQPYYNSLIEIFKEECDYGIISPSVEEHYIREDYLKLMCNFIQFSRNLKIETLLN